MRSVDNMNQSDGAADTKMVAELDEKFRRQAEYLKVLAHPIRLAIIYALKEGTCCVNDVSELLRVSQPNISQHLAILRREGIVAYTEDGKKRCYFLCDSDPIIALLTVLSKSK